MRAPNRPGSDQGDRVAHPVPVAHFPAPLTTPTKRRTLAQNRERRLTALRGWVADHRASAAMTPSALGPSDLWAPA